MTFVAWSECEIIRTGLTGVSSLVIAIISRAKIVRETSFNKMLPQLSFVFRRIIIMRPNQYVVNARRLIVENMITIDDPQIASFSSTDVQEGSLF